MKRKRSEEGATPPARKKSAPESQPKPSRLLQILTQYGLLVAITSNLFPKDLYALAATSKATYKAIFSRQESHLNLLHKMPCDGSGVMIRSMRHRKSKYFTQFNCTQYVECGTGDTTRDVETRPCESCSATTCDECRIHCVYQCIYQPTKEPDELPNLSGFALLSSPEMGILTPSHLGLDQFESPIDVTVATSPKVSGMKAEVDHSSVLDKHRNGRTSGHDQGFLDLPLESDTYASPEAIIEILLFDLGLSPLKLSDSSTSPHPSPVIRAFWDITERRKRRMCEACFKQVRHKNECHCTLKARFLDRWLCLRCFEHESNAVQSMFPYDSESGCCNCRQSVIHLTMTRIICLWCMGEVSDLTLASQDLSQRELLQSSFPSPPI